MVFYFPSTMLTRNSSWTAGLRAGAERLRALADQSRNIELWERLLATAALLDDLADLWQPGVTAKAE
jgi:hypothetical protein